MLTFTLYWGVYPQWTRQFKTKELAVAAARDYVDGRVANVTEFRLIQLVEIPLER
jgi:hypothetical protein